MDNPVIVNIQTIENNKNCTITTEYKEIFYLDSKDSGVIEHMFNYTSDDPNTRFKEPTFDLDDLYEFVIDYTDDFERENIKTLKLLIKKLNDIPLKLNESVNIKCFYDDDPNLQYYY